MRDVVSHYGTGGTSQRILEVPALAGTRYSLVIRLGREILATRSRYGVTGANCNPEGSDGAFDDVNAFVDAVAEVTQRYVKNLGHSSVRLRDMRDQVGDAGAQKEGSGREERMRNYRAVQDAGPAGRAPTADDEHVDENARFSILQTDDHKTGGHETARCETSYRAVVETRQEASRAAMIARHGQRQTPGGDGDSSDDNDSDDNDHRAPRHGIEDGFTPERADSSRVDTHKRSSRFLLPILTRTYDSSSVKCRFTGDVEDGVSFDGWRSRFYRLIGPSGFGVDDERLKFALIIAAVGGKAETFLLSDVNPDRSDPDPPPPRVAANSSPARTLRESFLRFEMYFLNSSTRAGLRTKAMSLSVRHLQRTHGLLLDQALRDIAEQIRKLAANGPYIYNNEAGMMDVMEHAVMDMAWTVPLRAQRNSGTAVSYTTLEEYVSGLCSFASSLAANDPAFLLAPQTPRSRPQPVMHAGDVFDPYSHAGNDMSEV
jgi:hypothetical protein